MKQFLFILISFTTFAQSPAIKFEIESIKSIDSISTERIFIINYYIENLTNNEVSFFLNPNNLIPNSRASMSKNVAYNLYENDEKLYLVDVFSTRQMINYRRKWESIKNNSERDKFLNENLSKEINIKIDSITKGKKEYQEIENYFLKKEREMLLKSRMKLAPKDIKKYSIALIWDKTRYYKIDDIEFYINENLPHYINLSINLMKEEFKDKLSPDEFQKIMSNPYFLKGWFTSNKMEINLRE